MKRLLSSLLLCSLVIQTNADAFAGLAAQRPASNRDRNIAAFSEEALSPAEVLSRRLDEILTHAPWYARQIHYEAIGSSGVQTTKQIGFLGTLIYLWVHYSNEISIWFNDFLHGSRSFIAFHDTVHSALDRFSMAAMRSGGDQAGIAQGLSSVLSQVIIGVPDVAKKSFSIQLGVFFVGTLLLMAWESRHNNRTDLYGGTREAQRVKKMSLWEQVGWSASLGAVFAALFFPKDFQDFARETTTIMNSIIHGNNMAHAVRSGPIFGLALPSLPSPSRLLRRARDFKTAA